MTFIGLPSQGSRYWRDAVQSVSDLPATATEGEVRLVKDDGLLYSFSGSSWGVLAGGGSGGGNSYFPGGWS